MLIKRLILALISLGVGVGTTWLIVITILDTTIGNYGTIYFVFTTLSIACALGIWLDKFMGTKILSE